MPAGRAMNCGRRLPPADMPYTRRSIYLMSKTLYIYKSEDVSVIRDTSFAPQLCMIEYACDVHSFIDRCQDFVISQQH